MNGSFFEQLGGVSGLFDQWGACEKTVVACALARKVPWPGLRLLQRAVEAAVGLYPEDPRLEREANDEVLLASLLTAPDCNEGGEYLRQLLQMLPLLRTDNDRAKDVYMTAAPSLVQRYVDARRSNSGTSDLCRQLLSYLLVHPALTQHDQRTLAQWLLYLESHISGTVLSETIWQKQLEPYLINPINNIWCNTNGFRRTIGKNVEFKSTIDSLEPKSFTSELDESFSKNGRDVDISIECDKINFDATIAQPKSQRSNSLTPPSFNFMHMSSSAENLSDEPFLQKPRSFSLSSEHSLGQIRPIGIMYGTTGSETRLDDLKSNVFYEYPGMSMVVHWLKSLRLHKYIWLFNNTSYEEMMSMDEDYLDKLGVTKGARHKLLLSIKKLNERMALLDSIESELLAMPCASVRTLEKLRGVFISPMPPSSDLPAAIVRVLEIASKSLMNGYMSPGVSRVPFPPTPMADEHDKDLMPVDPMSLHCWLVEKALHHESFQVPALTEALRRMRHRLPPRQFFHHVSDFPTHGRSVKSRWRTPPTQPMISLPIKRVWQAVGSHVAPPQRGKSHSYPPFPPQAALPRPPPSPSPAYSDEYSSLDALCLQMTEQAID